MKTQPVEPALVQFGSGAGDPPRSPLYDDLYHPRIGALAQARHVFLKGNGLPERWRGRRRFVIVETGFGLGNNFLATWDAWRHDPQRCERLSFVSVERHPLQRADLQRAHAGSPVHALAAELLQAWPPLTPNLHALDFDGGRVQLLLGFGDVATLLPVLRATADAFFLDGFAPARNPEMWQPRVVKALGRMAAPGATLSTWSVAHALRKSLASAGFEVQLAQGIGGKREITVARWAPRYTPRAQHERPAAAHEAVVVGAGIAGAATAQALARAGLAVTVLERHAGPAQETSGNPAGLFHGTVIADDGPHARLFRAGALHAQRLYGDKASGLLRLELPPRSFAAMQALLQTQGLPADYVQALDAAAASARAGVPLPAPAWFYPGGGWLAPAGWCAQALATPGVRFVGNTEVSALEREGNSWLLRDGRGQVIASAPIVVLANAASAARLLQPLGHGAWPLSHTRGQVTYWTGAHTLKMAVAGDGYALPLPGGLLCGATRDNGAPGDADDVRAEDHLQNLQRLQRLTGLAAPDDPTQWQGRTGWRLQADDRLPIAGALPLAQMPIGQRLDQARLLPRTDGLFVLTALGARGLTLAPLLARLVAAQAAGLPWPLEQDLADAVDPGRWLVRAARAAAPQPG